MKKALISGITGRDGAYLSRLLSTRATKFTRSSVARAPSTPRASTTSSTTRTPPTPGGSYYGDLSDGTGLRRILQRVVPVEIYNLAAQSHVRVSLDQPEYTADVVATGTLRLLAALRDHA